MQFSVEAFPIAIDAEPALVGSHCKLPSTAMPVETALSVATSQSGGGNLEKEIRCNSSYLVETAEALMIRKFLLLGP